MTGAALKERLRRRELTIGSWITLAHPGIAELMVRVGFDWLAVDMEHSAITLAEAQQLVQVIDLAGCVALVRVGANDPTLIKRAMDTGASGVIVPSVNTPEEAEQVVQAVRYPPVGTRGVGLGRAQGYGASFEEYRDQKERESIVIIQIEHVAAIRRLDAILSVPGLDGFFVGPYDLSGSLGRPGMFNDPEVKQALQAIQEAALRKGIASGIHVVPPDPHLLLEKVQERFCLIALCLDTMFLYEKAREVLGTVRHLLSASQADGISSPPVRAARSSERH